MPTIPTATVSRLARQAAGVRFTARRWQGRVDVVRVELADAPANGPARVREAAAALRAAGYKVRAIADGWKLEVTP